MRIALGEEDRQLLDVTAPRMTAAYQAAIVDGCAAAKCCFVNTECPPHHRCMTAGRDCAPAAAHGGKTCPVLSGMRKQSLLADAGAIIA